MQKLRAETGESAASLKLSMILKPYGYRAALWLAVSAIVVAALYVRVRVVRWWRAALNGFAAALLGLGTAWFSHSLGGAGVWLAPVVVFGVPAALWQLARRKGRMAGAKVFAAWMLAALVPLIVTGAWF